jgi:hypothetical protein
MNAVNSALTTLFDVLLTPFEWAGRVTALIVISGLFGVVSLLVFKKISWQAGIKAAKDRVKGHMIAIRIYQDDLGIVASSVGKVVLRNFQYLGLNIGPILPLIVPFAFISAQFVVRYAYRPLPVHPASAKPLAGQGTLLEIEMARGHEGEVRGLRVTLPAGLKAISPLVRVPREGKAFQEFIAIDSGAHEIAVEVGGAHETKLVEAGDVDPRRMQPRRVSNGEWYAIHDPDHWPVLWPAEAGIPADSPLRSIAISYPQRELPWWPDGELGVLTGVVVASIVVGAFALKPLGVQI